MKVAKLELLYVLVNPYSLSNFVFYIFILFIVIVDTLHHENIWKSWLSHTNSKYCAKLVIHAKNPEKVVSPWVRQKCIPISFHPEWNSPEVIRAMLAVLEEATKDVTYQRFIFATGAITLMTSTPLLCHTKPNTVMCQSRAYPYTPSRTLVQL